MKLYKEYTIYALIVFSNFFVIYLGYLMIYPFKTLEVYSAVAINEPKAGEVLLYEVDYCKYTTAPTIVYRTLRSVDEKSMIPFPAVDTITSTGCKKTSIPLQLLDTVPAGKYYLNINITFKVNAFREINYQFKTKPFNVLEKDE